MITIPAWLFWLVIATSCLKVITPPDELSAEARWIIGVIDTAFTLTIFFVFARGY